MLNEEWTHVKSKKYLEIYQYMGFNLDVDSD